MYIYIYIYVYLSIHLSIHPSIHPSIHVSIHLSICSYFLSSIVYYIMQLVGESREHEPFINNEEDTPSNNVSLMKFLVFLMKEVNMCVSLLLILSLYPLSESFNTLSLPPSLPLSLPLSPSPPSLFPLSVM